MAGFRPFAFDEKKRFMLALIAPAVLVLVFFQILPILTGANASFRDWHLNDPNKTWIGLTNYAYVVRDREFLSVVLPNTFGFMAASVASSLVAGLMIALLLNRQFPGRWLVQTIILLTDVWLWTPWFALLLLAGLQSLPPEPFEAAKIDAASAWRTFRYITLPMLRPVIVVCVVIRAIDAFRTFDIVWTISGGGPARATEVFSIYAYVEAFQFLNFGRGSAAAVLGAIIIVVFAMALYRLLNRWVEVSK